MMCIYTYYNNVSQDFSSLLTFWVFFLKPERLIVEHHKYFIQTPEVDLRTGYMPLFMLIPDSGEVKVRERVIWVNGC